MKNEQYKALAARIFLEMIKSPENKVRENRTKLLTTYADVFEEVFIEDEAKPGEHAYRLNLALVDLENKGMLVKISPYGLNDDDTIFSIEEI